MTTEMALWLLLALYTLAAAMLSAVTEIDGSTVSMRAITIGLLLGPLLSLGSYLDKRSVDRIPEHVFSRLIDVALIMVGLIFILRG